MTCPQCRSTHWMQSSDAKGNPVRVEHPRAFLPPRLRTCAGCGCRYFVHRGESLRLGYNQRPGVERDERREPDESTKRRAIHPQPDRDMVGADWREPE